MADPLDPKELTDLRESVMSLVRSDDALVALLEEMGIPLTPQTSPAR